MGPTHDKMLFPRYALLDYQKLNLPFQYKTTYKIYLPVTPKTGSVKLVSKHCIDR